MGSKETEEAVGEVAERLAHVLRHIEMWGSGGSNIKKINQKLSRDKEKLIEKTDFCFNVQFLLPLLPYSFRLWSMDEQ